MQHISKKKERLDRSTKTEVPGNVGWERTIGNRIFEMEKKTNFLAQFCCMFRLFASDADYCGVFFLWFLDFLHELLYITEAILAHFLGITCLVHLLFSHLTLS